MEAARVSRSMAFAYARGDEGVAGGGGAAVGGDLAPVVLVPRAPHVPELRLVGRRGAGGGHPRVALPEARLDPQHEGCERLLPALHHLRGHQRGVLHAQQHAGAVGQGHAQALALAGRDGAAQDVVAHQPARGPPEQRRAQRQHQQGGDAQQRTAAQGGEERRRECGARRAGAEREDAGLFGGGGVQAGAPGHAPPRGVRVGGGGARGERAGGVPQGAQRLGLGGPRRVLLRPPSQLLPLGRRGLPGQGAYQQPPVAFVHETGSCGSVWPRPRDASHTLR
jgi:hypothetical protein